MLNGSGAEIETNSQGPIEASSEDNITERPPLHSKDFFALHLAFAQKVQQLTGVNLDQALIKGTPYPH